MRKSIILAAVVAILGMFATADATPPMGQLYFEGTIVRTLVPPAAMTQPGTDPLYVIMGGASGQLPVVGTAPGDPDYRGGQWAFHSVTWNVEPYLLVSEEAVHDAAGAGDVTIVRVYENDFKCPVQP